MGHLSYQDLDHGITCIEAHYQREHLASCYLVQEGDMAAIIDCGTVHTVPQIMELLELKGLQPGQVRYVMPTHVHLDHAGGAGELMRRLPEASLVAHPYGARHLIDPSKLTAGATAVYGEEIFKRDFGELVAVDESRVIEAEDGYRVDLNGRILECLDTPGHARHHYCVWDASSRGFFTGDTFGIAYPELTTGQGPFIFPPSTPVQFDPAAWHGTLDRLLGYRPERMYLTHFGQVDNPEKLAKKLHEAIDAYVEMVFDTEPQDRLQALESKLMEYYLEGLRDQGCTLTEDEIRQLLSLDLNLNAQGLDIWLQRLQQTAGN